MIYRNLKLLIIAHFQSFFDPFPSVFLAEAKGISKILTILFTVVNDSDINIINLSFTKVHLDMYSQHIFTHLTETQYILQFLSFTI